jgi:holliday junction DNA helicase RuvA
MIGKIKGTLVFTENNYGLIETSGGVSYQTYLTPKIISQYSIGDSIDIFTYLQVRDDALVLFGFETKKEYDFFTLLLTVPGVGPKTAFGVISFTQTDELLQAVRDNSIDYFTRVPGLGKKTAMKIILELSQKMKQEFKMEKMFMSQDDKTVIDALVSLGYASQEAKNIFQKLPKDLSVEQKITTALKLTSSSKK